MSRGFHITGQSALRYLDMIARPEVLAVGSRHADLDFAEYASKSYLRSISCLVKPVRRRPR
jgi:hypothetical protein